MRAARRPAPRTRSADRWEAGVQAGLEDGVADSMTWRTSEALAGECPPWLEYRGIEDVAIWLLDMIDEMAH